MTPQAFGDKRRIRHHLQGIKLEPDQSAYDIVIELQVDDIRTHKLPPVKKGQALSWSDLSLPCDVSEDSTITLQITEVHPFRPMDPVGKATYHASQVSDQDGISIECENRVFKVLMKFMDEEEAKQAYSEAFEKVQRMENQPGLLERTGRVGDAFKTLLDLGSAMADRGLLLKVPWACMQLDPTGGAGVVFSVCTKAWEHLEQQEKQDVELGELVKSLARMIPSVKSIKSLADENLGETVTDMLNLIEDVSLFILNCRPRGSFERAWRSAISSEVQEQSQAYIAKFKELRKEFDTRVNVQALRAAEVEMGQKHGRRVTPSPGMNAKLRELRPADLAGYDPSRRCIANTRMKIIDELTAWAQNADAGPRLAWVHGLAGLGKSSIATSVCMRLSGLDVLASSFFCKRDSPDRRNPRQVLATIIFGLALRWEAYRDAVVGVIGRDLELHTKHIQPLYDTLVSGPHKSLAGAKRPTSDLVIVVDALDECDAAATRRQLLVCLQGMAQLEPWLKIIVTSRPDEDIREFFRHSGEGWYTEYNVLNYDALADVRVLIEDRLSELIQTDELPKDAVEHLSLRSNGLFIWAQTACQFILKGYDPGKRLKQVLAGTHMRDSSADLDILYTAAVKASALDEGDDNMEYTMKCLGVVVVTAIQSPLAISSLALLLDGHIPPKILGRVVGSLSSVLYVDEKQDGAVRISHPSFMDYITDHSRSKRLCVDQAQQNTVLARCCFKTMAQGLRFNICGLETSDQFNSDVPNLKSRVEKTIGPHLSYSCLYWPSHVADARISLLDECLRDFLFGPELLYWIEALSLLELLSAAPKNLLELMRCHMPDDLKDCRTALNDAYRFVLSFYDAISKSTPQLYVSALAFSPNNSGIAQRMRSHFPKLLSVLKGSELEWTPCLRSIWVSSKVNSVAYAPDGRRIVSGSDDGMVRIWDAEAGDAVLEPLTGHSGWVTSVAFSPDGRWIASGSSDMTIRVWDAQTGEAKGDPLRGHSEGVSSITFSADGRRIASGSADKTIRVWDWLTGESILELLGHSKSVQSVASSPDDRWIVSGSGDQTLRIWDAQTGEPALQPLVGHSDWVRSVEFSPDGNRVASGSDNPTVRIWDAKTGKALFESLHGHSDWVRSVAFSPDGGLVVSGSSDRTVRIWDAQTGAAVSQPLDGHSDYVYSVAYSPDGRRVVSGSEDKTIRIWDVASGGDKEMMQGSSTSNGHSAIISSVAFSPNGRRVVSGSDDKTVRIWGADTGAMVLGPLEGHTSAVHSVGYSSDGRRVVSGSGDQTIRIWDAETGNPVLESLRGHSGRVTSVAFSPDCRLIVSGSGDKTVRIWDAETGKAVLEPLAGHTDWVRSVAFSPDGRWIASGSDDNTVRIWDAETGRAALGPLTGHEDWVYSVAFSPDGSRLVSGSRDQTIRIWNAENGQPALDHLRAHEDWVRSVAFSPDGRWIISGSDDMTVRIWSAETSEAVHEPLRGHSSTVWSVAFSHDGRQIVSGSMDMTIRIWDVESHIAPSTYTAEVLPGTEVPLLPPRAAGNKVLAYSSQLARHMHPEVAGWVVSTEGKPVVWLPPEMREIDDSILCIFPARVRRPTIIDLTNFVHGDSWISVADV
ncbi:hypothetical protein FRC07_004185 [Ceratobasidium sp. 392]|nr:hypothetical protein FRC07_004185 [Ceratobasidium sp. 392]